MAAALTPDDEIADRGRRVAEAGRLLHLGGNRGAATIILERFLATAPAGPRRAHALARLSALLRDDDPSRATALLEQALAEQSADAALTVDVRMSLSEIMSRQGEPERALDEARLAVAAAEAAGLPVPTAAAIMTLCQMQLMDGRPVDEALLGRALDIENALGINACLESPPAVIAGLACFVAGKLDDAEAHWRRLLAACDATGLEYWRADMFMRLSQLAVCRGDLAAAAALAAEGLESAEQQAEPHVVAALLWACGLAASYRGDVEAAADLARRGMLVAAETSTPTYRLRNEALLGTIDLAQGNYQAAAERLAPLASKWRSGSARFLVTIGIDVDAVEALVFAGDLEQAASLVADMSASAYNVLGAAIIALCRGQLAAARGDPRAAIDDLQQALRLHDQISAQPLARGRILLLLGGAQLRLKERGAARATLSDALALFAGAGARIWAERARAELARIPGRGPGPADLTATELRVAELVASGRTNKEAAAELFLSVRAIESTLTKAYAKLGVRSRTELSARLRG